MRRRRENHRTLQFSRPVFTAGSRRLFLEPLEDRLLLDGAGLLEATVDPQPVDEGWKVVPGEVLVGLHTADRINDVVGYVESVNWPAAIGSLDATNTHAIYQIPHRQGGQLTVVKVSLPAAVQLDEAIAKLSALEVVDYAEPNLYYDGNPFLALPNDPEQFGPEHPAGDPVRYHHDKIQAPAAWDWFQTRDPDDWGGKGVVVAVIDSGVDYTHPDLYENIWINQGKIPPQFKEQLTHTDNDGLITFVDLNDAANADYVSDLNGNTYIDADDLLRPIDWDPVTQINTGGWENSDDDDLIGWDFGSDIHLPDNDPMDWDPYPGEGYYGHGTHVAGLIAATTNNSTGVAGVAGQATIMPIRIDTTYDAFQYATACEALAYATDNGADIVNVSWEVPYAPYYSELDSFRIYLDYMYGEGVLPIFSVGNYNDIVPASRHYPQALYVAATDQNDLKAYFSSYGSGIDISAPGERIYSTGPVDAYNFWPGGSETLYSGNSMSAPIVSGVAALIWSAHPEWERTPLGRDKVAATLLGTADNIDHLNQRFIDLQEDTVLSYEGLLGTGRVNALEAVTRTVADPPDPPRIRGVREIPDAISRGMTELNVDVIGVFDGTTVTASTMVNGKEHLTNWKLIWAGTIGPAPEDYDREFDNGPGLGTDAEIGLIANLTPEDYSAYEDYKIGMNTLKFTIDVPDIWENGLEPGYYRFKAVADDPQIGGLDGLADPFGQPLDGDDDDQTAGGDYIYDFFVHADIPERLEGEYNIATHTGEKEFKLASFSYGQHNEYIEAYFDDDPQPMQIAGDSVQKVLAGELSGITITGSSGNDLITIPADVQTADFNGSDPGTITLDPGTGTDDKAVLYGSDVANFFRADHEDATAGRMPAVLSNEYVTITVSEFEQVVVNAGSGHNGADFYDQPGVIQPEKITASHDQATDVTEVTIERPDWKNTVKGFDTVLVGQQDPNGDEREIGESLKSELVMVDPANLLFWDRTSHEWYTGEWTKLDGTEGSPSTSSHLIVRNQQCGMRNDRTVQDFTVSEEGIAHVDEGDNLTVTEDLTAVNGLLAVDGILTVGGNVKAKLDSTILGSNGISVGGDVTATEGGVVSATSGYSDPGNISVDGDVTVGLDSSISASGSFTVGTATESADIELAENARIDVGTDCDLGDLGNVANYTTHLANGAIGQINAGGTVTLNATSALTVDVEISGPTAKMFQAGVYTLISAEGTPGIDGQFASSSITDLGSYASAGPNDDGLTYTTDSLTLTIDKDLHPGDANLDTDTDLTDFNIWNANKFTSDTIWQTADFNADVNTDLSDFNIWNQYKFTSAGSQSAAPAGGPMMLSGGESGQTMAMSGDNMIDVYYDAQIGWVGLDTTGASLVTLIVDGPPATTLLRWEDGTYQDGATWTQRYFNGAEQWGALAGGPVPESLYFLAYYPPGLTAEDFGPVEFFSNGEILYTYVQIVNGSQQSSAPSQMSAFWLEGAAVDAALASEPLEPTTESLELLAAELVQIWQQGQESLGTDPATAQALAEQAVAQLLATDWAA